MTYDLDFRKGRWASETQRLYSTGWRKFVDWCAQRELCPLPAEPETISAYIADLAKSHKWAGVQSYLNAVRAGHRLVKAECEDQDEAKRYIIDMDHPAILDAIKGIKRENGTRSEPKAALTWKDLVRVVEKIPEDERGLRDKAMLLIGWGAALRRSEVVALNVNDLTFSDEGVQIMIRRSKTDQSGQGTILRIPRAKKGLCAVAALEDYLDYRSVDPISETPVFINRTGNRCTGWDYALMYKRCVARAGLDPTKYSGHSGRRGYITTAFERNAPLDSIMEKSRHKTPAMTLHYREASQVFDNRADKAIWG